LRGPRALVPEGYFFLAGSGEDESGQIIARTCTDVPNNAFIVIPTILNIWCSESHFDFCQTNVNPVAEVFTTLTAKHSRLLLLQKRMISRTLETFRVTTPSLTVSRVLAFGTLVSG
jgi:hypothetical protein